MSGTSALMEEPRAAATTEAADQTSTSLLHADHLSKVYPDGQVNALLDVTLDIHRGEYVAIMGPSGSGKSTLLNLFGALDRPTSGEVYFSGEPLSTLPNLDEMRKDKIGFVFQSFFLIPTLSAAENVQVPMFGTARTGKERVAKAEELLAQVGLSHRAKHQPSRLSGGERQRVAIARALANDPDILLADEPTGNLDTKTGNEILGLFDRLHQERGMTVIVITHDEEVAHRARRVVRMRDGKIESDERNA